LSFALTGADDPFFLGVVVLSGDGFGKLAALEQAGGIVAPETGKR
jgi:hypothetical protein